MQEAVKILVVFYLSLKVDFFTCLIIGEIVCVILDVLMFICGFLVRHPLLVILVIAPYSRLLLLLDFYNLLVLFFKDIITMCRAIASGVHEFEALCEQRMDHESALVKIYGSCALILLLAVCVILRCLVSPVVLVFRIYVFLLGARHLPLEEQLACVVLTIIATYLTIDFLRYWVNL